MAEEYEDYEVEELKERLETMKEKVMYILRKYPQTRNNDLYLWLLLVREFYPELSQYIKFIPYDVLRRAPSFETVRRVRQKIQNEMGLYPPTDPRVLRKRRRLREVWKKAIVQV